MPGRFVLGQRATHRLVPGASFESVTVIGDLGGRCARRRDDEEGVFEVRVTTEVERNVGHRGAHRADERSSAEEERPAVVVAEGRPAVTARFRLLLPVRNLVVDRRDVEDDSHAETQRWEIRHTHRNVIELYFVFRQLKNK